METIILNFIPQLSNYPLLLILTEILTFLFFGGFIFGGFWKLFSDYTGN